MLIHNIHSIYNVYPIKFFCIYNLNLFDIHCICMVHVMHITIIYLLYDNNYLPCPCTLTHPVLAPGTQHPPAWTYGSWIFPTLLVYGGSKSASSWTSGVLSFKPSVDGAGGRKEPQNPENKRYMRYQLYIQVYVSYIHGIHMVYTDVTWKHMVAADLFLVWLYIHVTYISYS
jgi:hypothetical protein